MTTCIRYVVARYQAIRTSYDFSKESNNEPDLNTRPGGSSSFAPAMLTTGLVTTHTDEGYYASGPVQGLLDFRTVRPTAIGTPPS